MRRALTAGGAGILAALTLATAAAAADPTPTPAPAQTQLRARDVAPAVLRLSAEQIRELRQDGLSLAQIAERENVDPQKLVLALSERWTERIEVRLENGALTSEQAAALKAEVQARATEMVQQTSPGGMGGAAVGAGPRGAGAPGAGSNTSGAGARLGARGAGGGNLGLGSSAGPRGTGTGTGICDGDGPHGAGRP